MSERIYDLIIIGGGPAGLTAGIYAGRSKLDVLIIEKEERGSQIAITDEVLNYPGILETTGSELVEIIKKQSQNFGVSFAQGEVLDMDFKHRIKVLKTSKGEYKALSIIIAIGASPKKLNFKGETEYTGRGISYCATCDGELFTDLDVFVVGAGYSAAEEALFLTKYAKRVHIIAREPDFTCPRMISDRVKAHPKIEVSFNTEVVEATGDRILRKLKLRNNKTHEETEFAPESGATFGLFIFIGYEPKSEIFRNHVYINNAGYIPTDEDLMTNIEGVYAVGDIRPKKLKQVVTAVADGAIAATNIERYVYELREELGISVKEEVEEETTMENIQQRYLNQEIYLNNQVELAVIYGENENANKELLRVMKKIEEKSDKINVRRYSKDSDMIEDLNINLDKLPAVAILNEEKKYSRVKYSAMLSGHEYGSFIHALQNIGGNSEETSEELIRRIKNIDKKLNIKVGTTEKCTRCPATVQSAQKTAILNENIDVEILDLYMHPDFKIKHDILSVPVMVINDKILKFGQLSLEEVVNILEKI